MTVERDNCTAEFDASSIIIRFPENVECTDRQLDNILQFVMLQLGIDVKWQEPQAEPPVLSFPEPPPIPLVEATVPPERTEADVT